MIKLMKGDCLELIQQIPEKSIDLILTDPPYGIDYQSNRIKDKTKRKGKILNDKEPFISFITQLKRIIKDTGSIMIFTRWDVQQITIDELKNNNFSVKNVLIWDKMIHGMGDLKRSFGNRYESIIFCAEKDFRFPEKRPQDIIQERKVMPKDLQHPNEKPIKLLETLIKYTTKEEDTILDLFMGSGTTGIAAKNTNRNFIGFELDEKYYNLALSRINN